MLKRCAILSSLFTFTCMRLRRFNLLKGFIVLFFIITSIDVFAQDAKVGFKIITSKKEPVAFASVQVTDIADSMASQNKITDSLGSVNFNLTSGAQYRVQISSVNFETLTKGIRVSGSDPQFIFTLQFVSGTLSNVVVTATRPLIRQEDDKTIVDPENLAASFTKASFDINTRFVLICFICELFSLWFADLLMLTHPS